MSERSSSSHARRAADAELDAMGRDYASELEVQLHVSQQQLQSYATDLRRAYDVMKEMANELERAHYDTLLRLLRAARFKDEETGAHLVRLSHYTRLVAEHLGLNAEKVERFATAAPLHDVGKVGIPDAVLHKNGSLDSDEWELMKTHSGIGAALLKSSKSPLLSCAGAIALGHHERWDGSGYPKGTKGDETPLSARIVMLVDVYDALRSKRAYKPAFTHERTATIITEGDGRTKPQHFDPQLLEAFDALHERFATIFDEHADHD